VSWRRVCVYAGASAGADPAYRAIAEDLAATLAQRGIGIVYGGGSVGLMGALADASLTAGNEVVGIIPRFLDDREVGHRSVTELRVVDTMHERKMLMAELSDAFIALPGGIGTLEELIETLSWSQLGLHRKPMGLLDVRGYWDPLVRLLDHATQQSFIRDDHRSLLLSAEDPDALLDAMLAWRPPPGNGWLSSREET
jgi:uncharacterized protein (TIGR00730 family)